jgi:hypothetical protein
MKFGTSATTSRGDIEELPTDENVEEVLVLMGEVLNEVFQGPARTARSKARREGSNMAG